MKGRRKADLQTLDLFGCGIALQELTSLRDRGVEVTPGVDGVVYCTMTAA
jgi:hypothetical protein